ncbi:MAG: hypothetical protein UU95_C0008G0004 [Parcubacteria group bacterium GW2011_GWC2_42_12]|uniref:Uncharacterized protein n=2 Tax=Candidatus Falkowiibacteriota TaxID=1752728 RepID=A0A1F5SAC0_9BACT|nr:MAG: hypothetical protein UU43_C0001G0064 [Candidatus Falkowbacteria bacterium GW2011_GWA2_41_14]KKS34796.1 MAG: hypothetical protein UU95_C0008G0004 [Parcubacteria group bacterium GW2011_GWC2_42_12]OGF23599.1 MAG: hypothetical protein A3D45_00605 [Candidatus Falkowbacteria bacterium RIFCSPHIGHO2_02_FULL_42_9]
MIKIKNIINKIRSKHIVIFCLLLIGGFIVIYLYFLGWRFTEFNFMNFKLEPSNKNHSILVPDKTEPKLCFNDVRFLYYDSQDKAIEPLENNGDVNLEEIDKMRAIAEIENCGNFKLLISLKRLLVYSSYGHIILNVTPDIPSDNFPLSVGEKVNIPLGGPVISDLLKWLKKDNKFYFIFKPQIEFYLEGEKKNLLNLNIFMRCSNQYISSKLPLFKPFCVPEQETSN